MRHHSSVSGRMARVTRASEIMGSASFPGGPSVRPMLWRILLDPDAPSTQPGEWSQRGPDQERGRIRYGDLASELEQDAREVWESWKSGAAKASRQTQRLVLREELLHA